MRSSPALYALFFAAAACGGGEIPIVEAPKLTAPKSLSDPTPSAACFAQPAGLVTEVEGEVSGVWSGHILIKGALTIAKGAELEICPGTVLTSMDSRATLTVEGALILSGTRESMILFDENEWSGIIVHGKMSGGYFQMGSVLTCIDGRNTSEISLIGAQLVGCSQAFSLWNGGEFDRLMVLGGHTSNVNGGILSVIDSLIDLRHPSFPPDCTYWSAGGAQLDHVRFTGCHCPIHVVEAHLGFRVTNSVLDGASVSVMIAETEAEFSGNNIPQATPQILDIGGDLKLDLSNNYWGGGEPTIISDEMDHIVGIDQFANRPFDDVGPR